MTRKIMQRYTITLIMDTRPDETALKMREEVWIPGTGIVFAGKERAIWVQKIVKKKRGKIGRPKVK